MLIVTIYYNDVDLRKEPYIIHPNCPTLNLPVKSVEEATEFAEKKVSSGEWKGYLIPDLTTKEFIYEL